MPSLSSRSTGRPARRCLAFAVLAAAVGCSSESSSEKSSPDAKVIASGKNLDQIGIALQMYETNHADEYQNGLFPMRFLRTRDGEPGLSWRVTILPELGLEDLYAQFKLDEPWDSPHNKPLVAKMPDVYRSPRGQAPPGHTNYLAVTGPTAFLRDDKPSTMASVSDGWGMTIGVVEVDDAHAVEWTRPDDFTWQADAPAEGLGWPDDERFLVVLVDASVQLLPKTIAPKDLAAMYTARGREVISDDSLKHFGPPMEAMRGYKARRENFALLTEARREERLRNEAEQNEE